MKDKQKKKITRNYHLPRRVESWKWCRETTSICPNCSGIQTNAWNTSKKKNNLSFTGNREVKQFYVVPINDHEFSLSWSPSTLNVGCMYFVTYIPTDVTGQRVQGSANLKNTAIPQYRKKNWQIPEYSVKDRRNTDTAFIFGHAYLKLYLSRVFVYLKHLCTSKQPQPLRGNVRRPRIDRYNDRKGCPANFIIDYVSEIV